MTMITAHSGSDNMGENSWTFIRFCLDRQLCFEIDVRQQTDGTLILAHDRQEVVPESVTLEQVFQAVANEKTTMTINCDLKEEGLEMAVFSLAQTYQIWTQIVLSGYVRVSWAAIWGKHIFYNIENQFEGKKLGDITEADLIETLQELAYQSVQIVNIHEGWLTELAREVGQQLGLTFSVWTVNELETIEYLASCGVYNITSRCAWAYLLWKKGAKSHAEILESQASLS
ncbi:hypothetical protein BH748_16230 [Enterococcus casseliflavus]|uniref:glycerophosphodiester phosphodiesterase n=1 Tax=Enterococcus casseliflavus TaxID=37734 RepID=UPI0009BE9917|nr:glycerophosphodiester phosphodiesterase [Enterococcus casseliflavus]OQO82802.1 hypothetical protein BH748_16230 [Enterococcus casseliflavus]